MRSTSRVVSANIFSRTKLVISAMLALTVSVTIQAGGLRAGFYDGPRATPGNNMFFSVYSILPSQKGHANMQKIADGHFTAAGPYYGSEGDPTINSAAYWARIEQARNLGLQYIAHMPMHPAVINDTNGNIRPDSMDAIAESQLRSYVRTVMDFTLNNATANPTVGAWYLLPEELRPWKSGEMNYLRVVADEIHNYDPLGRPVTMYSPNHRTSSQLEDIANQGGLDRTMMGVYVTDVPFNTRGARVAEGVNRIVAAATNSHTSPAAVFQLSEDFDGPQVAGLASSLGGVSTTQAIKHVIRHDVYQGLLRGIQNVQIWSGCDCRTGLTSFSEQLEGYISVSNDVNGSLNLARVFLQGEDKNDFQATVLSGPLTVTYDTTTFASAAIADIALGSERFLFLINSSNSPLELKVVGLPAEESGSQINDLFGNVPDLNVNFITGELLLTMQPLEVIGLQIVPNATGDYNGNGIVDAADYIVWRQWLGKTGVGMPADGVRDRVIDQADYHFWRSRFGESVVEQVPTHSVASVPEPATFLIVLSMGLLLVLACRKLNYRSDMPAPRSLITD